VARVSEIARVAADAGDAAAEALRRDGIVAIEGLWSPDTIDALGATVEAQHPEFADLDALEDYLGDKHERFIAPVALTAAVRESGLCTNERLEAVNAAMLGDDYVYEAFGVLMVRPGAPAQEPHRDGGLLFPETGVDRILPPSALTVAIPLVEITTDYAPTGAAPGSHRNQAAADPADLIPIDLNRGDAAIWDFRTNHAGLANRTDRARPALYFTVCRPYWIDHKNFHANARAKLVGDPAVLTELGPRFVRGRPW
jgi:ectoine hydroxylase-related dioxygenase (phytanoyl-CoA dioxygenase family)